MEMGLNPQREKFKTMSLLPSVLTVHERNSQQEAEQAEKSRTRMEILQHRKKCCVNTICYINVLKSSATMSF